MSFFFYCYWFMVNCTCFATDETTYYSILANGHVSLHTWMFLLKALFGWILHFAIDQVSLDLCQRMLQFTTVEG